MILWYMQRALSFCYTSWFFKAASDNLLLLHSIWFGDVLLLLYFEALHLIYGIWNKNVSWNLTAFWETWRWSLSTFFCVFLRLHTSYSLLAISIVCSLDSLCQMGRICERSAPWRLPLTFSTLLMENFKYEEQCLELPSKVLALRQCKICPVFSPFLIFLIAMPIFLDSYTYNYDFWTSFCSLFLYLLALF